MNDHFRSPIEDIVSKIESSFKGVNIIKIAIEIIKYTMRDQEKFKGLIDQSVYPMKKIKNIINYGLFRKDDELKLRYVPNP